MSIYYLFSLSHCVLAFDSSSVSTEKAVERQTIDGMCAPGVFLGLVSSVNTYI